jgi:hypothetical protein
MKNDNLRENLRRAASRRGYLLRTIKNDGGEIQGYALFREGTPLAREMHFHDLEDVRNELRLLNSELPSRAA